MFQARRRRMLMGVVLGATVAMLGTGCGSSRSARVDDTWLARVPEDQLGEVRDAEAQRRKAHDGVTRADVALKDAERALQVAQRNEEASRLRMKANEAALEAAQATGQRADIERARAELMNSETGVTAAKAQVSWRQQSIEAMEAQKALREKELELADAELSEAQYRALKGSGDVRADELSEADFAKAVAEARRGVEDARKKVDSQSREEQQARAQWERLRTQAQGYGGSGLPPQE
jgi:chromosome segregation ATPase